MSYDRQLTKPQSNLRKPFTQNTKPEDFLAAKLEGQTWTRLPGQVAEQLIRVEECKNSLIYVIDECDSVQVDNCVDCKFFLGPTLSSVFLRGCRGCDFVVACGQLRMRDCKECRLSLFCQGRPVIESSTRIGVGCYVTMGYFQLSEHFAAARLSVFNNMYTMVHDFTPQQGNGGSNFYYLEPEVCSSLLEPLWKHSEGFISEEEERVLSADPVIPYTHGVRPNEFVELYVVVFRPGHVESALDFVTKFIQPGQEKKELLLLHTLEHVFIGASFDTAFESINLEAGERSRMTTGPCICFAMAAPTTNLPPSLEAFSSTEVFRNEIAFHTFGQQHDREKMNRLVNNMFCRAPLQSSGFGSSLS